MVSPVHEAWWGAPLKVDSESMDRDKLWLCFISLLLLQLFTLKLPRWFSFFLQNRTSYLSAGVPPSIAALFVPSWGGLAVCILFGSMSQESVPLGASALLASAASKLPQEEMKPLPII